MEPLDILIALNTPDGKADPYPLYNALHEMGEVVEIGDNDVFVVGYDAINSVLRDPGFLVSSTDTFDAGLPQWRQNPVFVQAADWILNLNAPKHSRIRSLIGRAFTARRIGGLEPAIVKMANGLLDDIADRGADGSAVEFMHDFAYLLPITVICELIGIPESDREAFRPVARDLAAVFENTTDEDLPRINSAAVDLLAYFSALATVKRANPSDDLLSDLLAIAESGDGRLTDAELLHNLTLLLVAGFETTTNLLGNGRRGRRERIGPGRELRRRGAALRLARPAHQPDRLRHQASSGEDRREQLGGHAARRREPGSAPVLRPRQIRPAARRRRAA